MDFTGMGGGQLDFLGHLVYELLIGRHELLLILDKKTWSTINL